MNRSNKNLKEQINLTIKDIESRLHNQSINELTELKSKLKSLLDALIQ